MKRRMAVASVLAILLVTLFTAAALATEAKIYLASDMNGQNPVTNIKEGDQVYIVVDDPDNNIDCDVRDKIWVDLKIFDPKTGAYIVWDNGGYTGRDGNKAKDYLEETGPDTGLFVSKRPFQVGTRESYDGRSGYIVQRLNTHIVGPYNGVWGTAVTPTDFRWGHYEYAGQNSWGGTTNVAGDQRGWYEPRGAGASPYLTFDFNEGFMAIAKPAWLPSDQTVVTDGGYLLGRFENMDTLVVMYQDYNDETDVALSTAKITDTESRISWNQEVYKDARGSATITVTDPDENLNCNKVEYVPVFILVNPGSWNPMDGQSHSATNFCMLMSYGGIDPQSPSHGSPALFDGKEDKIRWYNIYDSGLVNQWALVPAHINNKQEQVAGTYFVEYPVKGDNNVTYFDTADLNGYARVMFYAQETGVNTGVFQLNINNILDDLGFTSLDVRDVLVAYYVDPNDFDDMTLATAYIEEHQHSITSFTDATRVSKNLFWIGRDPVYVQVIDSNANVDPCCPEQVVVHICDVHGEDDSEWVILDETSSNSPVFFKSDGIQLLPVWDALGLGLAQSKGGYQLQLDNWKLEVFNEDTVFARYNDVYYETDGAETNSLAGLGDIDITTAFPPAINSVRVDNDVSFDLMKIGDTQVYNGTATTMYFLDRQGNRVSGYVNSDCVFIEVVDPDQNEDNYRRERVDGYWDGGQNAPFGPVALNDWHCDFDRPQTHPVNALLGDTNIFNDSPATSIAAPIRSSGSVTHAGWAKIYVLNPRNGRWAATDILETQVGSGDFVSVICIDIADVYPCVPTLGVRPGDTIVAAYQDPSNHSDVAYLSIKVGIGGGGTPVGQGSTTKFTDASGNLVANYMDVDTVYVKVVDPSHAGAAAASLLDTVKIGTATFDLAPLAGAATDTFITGAITLTELGKGAGDTITATYTDPTDPSDTSSATISVIASELAVEEFIAKPNPFATDTVFTYVGSGIATTFTVTVYDLAGHVVWTDEKSNVSEVTWDGKNASGVALANGAYIYVVLATDGTNTFTGKGKVFIDR